MNTHKPATNIRDARADDLPVLVQFNIALALETEHKVLEPNTVRQGVGAVLNEPRHGFYLVAEHAGVAIGCLMITREWSDWRNGDWWWLQSVYVQTQHRRDGIFRKLFAELEHRARMESNVIGLRLYVERDNANAMKTYANMGLREVAYRVYENEFKQP